MPNVVGLTVNEAKKELKELGIQANIVDKTENIDEKDKQKVVIEQLPKKGIQINSNAVVTLYVE